MSKGQQKVLIVGKGGDGVVLIAEILGLAATLDGCYVSQRNNYGPSQRGEALFSEVIISKEPIQYTFIDVPTYYISLSQQGFDASFQRMDEKQKGKERVGTILYIDSTQKYDLKGLDKRFTINNFAAKHLAIENDLPFAGNIIMLSYFTKTTGVVSKDSLKQALLKRISKRSQKQNLEALKIGWR